MAKLRMILATTWCLFLTLFSACSASGFCSSVSLVDIQKEAKGIIIFPLTTMNYTTKMCQAKISSPSNVKTNLTLTNLRRIATGEQCHEMNYIDICTGGKFLCNQTSLRFCKSVGSVERITLRSTIWMTYRAPFSNDIGEKSTKNAVSVQYKKIDNKTCRYVLKDPSGVFNTLGYPVHPQHGVCEWVIVSGKGREISLQFEIQNISYLDYRNNFIEVYEGDTNIGSPLKKIFDPSQPTKITSLSTKLLVRIKSYQIGFKATYETCRLARSGAELDFYSPERTCQTWNLTATLGHIAALSFSQFDIPSASSDSCSDNVLQVWDGKTTTTYCNIKSPPSIITSQERNLIVRYRPKDSTFSSFQASFASILPSSYKTNCFVHEGGMRFKCSNGKDIPCLWQCDGAMQCADNSDESLCSEMEERWHKLQIFVIVMGSICASTVIFCVGLICFKKCIIHDVSSMRHGRHSNDNDQSPLTPNADLPSPPPCYFSDREEDPPTSVIRGTYFFGDEFSQSGIHSASLFGIPPPRYRSTESLHQSNSEPRSIWQRGFSSIPLVPEDNSRDTEIISLPEEGPPDYETISADKNERIMIAARDDGVENATCAQETPESSSNECIENENGVNTERAIELQVQTPVSETNGLTQEIIVGIHNIDIDIGKTNAGASLNV